MRVRVLDLRFRQLTAVEAAVNLEDRGVLELHGATAALVTELESLSFTVVRDADVVRASKGPVPELLDLTGLEAPEPMLRVLLAFSKLQPREVCLALLPRQPLPLFPQLEARKASYEVALRPDGKALLWLSR